MISSPVPTSVSCSRTPDLPYEVVTPGDGNYIHSVPSIERPGAIEVAQMAAEAMAAKANYLADEALWDAWEL